MKRKIVYILSILLILCGVAYAVDMKGDYKFVGPTVDFTNTTVTGISSTSGHTAIVTITAEDSTTNTVTDYITTSHTTDGTVASGFGTGFAFDMEDLGGTEEQARINVVLTTETDGAEDSKFDFNVQSAGALSTIFTLQGASSSTAADSFTFNSTTTELNAEITTGIFKLTSVGTELAGLGATHEYFMVDAGGSEIQAEFATVFTTVADGAEDVDLVWRQNDNGTVRETMRMVADNDGTTEGTRMLITSTSQETNGVLHPLVLAQSGGTTITGFGVGISMQAENDDGVNTACELEAVFTDVGTGSRDADFVVNCANAGTVEEVFRVNSDGQIQTSKARIIVATQDSEALLTLAECGATIFLNHATSGIDSVLPAVAGSNGCEFKWVHMILTSDDHSISTDSGEDKIVVQFFIADGNAGAAADVNADIVSFVDTADTIGDTCRAVSNGAFWFMQCNGGVNGAFSSGTT